MKKNLRALRFNLLAAIVTFVVGTAVASFKFPSNVVPQDNDKIPTADRATANPPAVDCPRTAFHTSNISRITSMLNQVESTGTAKTNTFYVEEVDDKERGGEFAQVYWKEDGSVMFITPPYDAEKFDPILLYLKRIDLDRDVVPTEADVGTSNYLVPKPWIEEVLNHCVHTD